MRENEQGKLFPGIIQVVGSRYQALFKAEKSELFETYQEAEDWILQRKETDGYRRACRRVFGR